ncbi:MAG: hypothetical protein JSR99_15700 [Proteobacteria bacterium]|nr:hypothetical protein [Pseudomonadota bacterium]
MMRVYGASAFVAAAIIAFAADGNSGREDRSVLFNCAGMELAQSAAPNDTAPDANSGTEPDGGSTDGGAQQPNDDSGSGDDDGANSDQASPPDSAQPPGCIFRNEPLQLLV